MKPTSISPQGTYDVVVCARNNANIIAATLEKVARQTLGAASCTVVDGRSTDGTPAMVRSAFPSTRVLIKEEDDGPASSRNLGARSAVSDYLLFLDSDVLLAPDWAERQVAFLEAHPLCAAVCGKLCYAAEPGRIYATTGAMNRYGVAWEMDRGAASESVRDERVCLWCATAALLVRRSVFEQSGGFDAAMFAFHEDSDFGWRLNLLGFQVMLNPLAVAGHEVHGTMTPGTMGSRIAFLSYRNRFRSMLVNYQWPSLLRYVPLHCCLFLLQTLYRGPRSGRLRALAWNVAQLPDTLRRRRLVQGLRRVPDSQLWPLFAPGLSGPGYRYD